MQRIESVNARPDLNGSNKKGFHDNADLAGQEATYLTPQWCNSVQEELANIVEGFGESLSTEKNDQIFNILKNFATNNNLEQLRLKLNDLLGQEISSIKDELKNEIGLIKACPVENIPEGYLECAGQMLEINQYPDLFNRIQAVYGGDGVINFKLPDLRGEFIRGWDHGKGVDNERVLGTNQVPKSLTVPCTGWGAGPATTEGHRLPIQGKILVGSGGSEIYEELESVAEAGHDLNIDTSHLAPHNISMIYVIKAKLSIKKSLTDVQKELNEFLKDFGLELDKTLDAVEIIKRLSDRVQNLENKPLFEDIKVGDIFLTMNTFNSSQDVKAHKGYGQWEQVGNGHALVTKGHDNSRPDWMRNLGNVGGGDTHQLTIDEMPRHQHSDSAIYNKFAGMADEVHETGYRTRYGLTVGGVDDNQQSTEYQVSAISNEQKLAMTEKLIGGNQPHSNIQLSLIIGAWRRIG